MNYEIIFVTTKKEKIYKKTSKLIALLDIKWFESKNELFQYFLTNDSKPILISYNHNIIFPKWLLDKVLVGEDCNIFNKLPGSYKIFCPC